METEVQKKIEKNGMIISRIPLWAKQIIQDRANEEFSDDYGMCISSIIKESLEYNELKRKFFDGEVIMHLSKIDSSDINEIKMASGKTIKYKNSTN